MRGTLKLLSHIERAVHKTKSMEAKGRMKPAVATRVVELLDEAAGVISEAYVANQGGRNGQANERTEGTHSTGEVEAGA